MVYIRRRSCLGHSIPPMLIYLGLCQLGESVIHVALFPYRILLLVLL